ncbi:MAG: hypothetical protein AB7U75_02200 [Hyphomicrobiaceae bacterium]
MLIDSSVTGLVDIVRLGVEVLGFGGVIYGFYKQRQTLQTNVALDFFRRYDEITQALPEEIRGLSPEASMADLSPEHRHIFMNFMRRYLNLCSEEFALRSMGRIQGDIWKIWSDEIEAAFARKAWREAWGKLRGEFASYPKFETFIGRLSPFKVSRQ